MNGNGYLYIRKCFNDLKLACSSQPTLVYYDVSKPVKILCDSSQYGLGAVCLQNEKPVAYASRSPSDAEKLYAQIEDLLAIVYALRTFSSVYFMGEQYKSKAIINLLNQFFRNRLIKAHFD